MTRAAHLGKISAASLFVSEPHPVMFGNPSNPRVEVQKASGWASETQNWLKSRFHFSFAEYHNPNNQQFGCLRVMNDDLVQPKLGFGTHGHAEMEIATYVVEGELTHKDSMGTAESLGRGSVQFMTAGTGVRHSEFNQGEKPLRFIQMWVTPQQRGLKPNYGSVCGDASAAERKDRFAHLVAPVGSKESAYLQLNQDVNMYVTELSTGKEVTLNIAPGRQAYGLLIEGAGDAKIGDLTESLTRHDGMEIIGGSEDSTLTCTATGDAGAHWLIVEMKEDGRGGRTTRGKK